MVATSEFLEGLPRRADGERNWPPELKARNDGRIELDNNPGEHTIRPISLKRKKALFAGHKAGAQNCAIIASLIEICKPNGTEPHGYLAGVLKAIAAGHNEQISTCCCPGTTSISCERLTTYRQTVLTAI
tara:strand:+ start:1092 stop:1481 length:390 start_codon:yes stop_codon:yes gene_type:complete